MQSLSASSFLQPSLEAVNPKKPKRRTAEIKSNRLVQFEVRGSAIERERKVGIISDQRGRIVTDRCWVVAGFESGISLRKIVDI